MNQLWKISYALIMLVFLVTACQPAEIFPAKIMLKPGDSIGDMTLTRGTGEADPLRSFCPSLQTSEYTITAHCHVPLLSKLAIGTIFMPTSKVLSSADWSEFTWELSIDGRTLDLDAFGTYDYVLPTLSAPPCPIREVFASFPAWDVVLADLRPGSHLLHSTLQTDTETYTRTVFLTIKRPL